MYFLKYINKPTIEIVRKFLSPHQVIWRRVKGRMPVGRAAVVKGKGLRVSPLRPEDSGIYVCEATNRASSISANASLEVHSESLVNHRMSFVSHFMSLVSHSNHL